jgi:hypothetical protein
MYLLYSAEFGFAVFALLIAAGYVVSGIDCWVQRSSLHMITRFFIASVLITLSLVLFNDSIGSRVWP